MPGDDTSQHLPTDAPVTIELRESDGRIVVRRDTALGTYERTVDR
ncbi:hypothetical protein SAMN04488063_1173 [Halopelagius inordinatus]|uniref:Halobacterial output domain-containing protein n=1 Tax=Halopelagius inordinatus TaxID=553467 RepID=A0A1I2NMU8_9EURY|nr:hypothetical protein [Halopelagius inordinatus]SFG02611.1 hypothetical protein SAMN04488063_1173 [Halopelagius inordinatus]